MQNLRPAITSLEEKLKILVAGADDALAPATGVGFWKVKESPSD